MYIDDFKQTYIDNEPQYDIKQQIRLNFIRKVYGILSIQLLITTIFTLISCVSTSMQQFYLAHSGLFFIMVIIEITISVILTCCTSYGRQVPHNYILLLVFTLAESYIVGFICAFTNGRVVLMAAFMTFCMCVAITIYAITTKTDFTLKGGLLFICGCGFMLLCFFGLFTNNPFFHCLLSAIGVCLFGFYLVYDTQLIIGNKSEIIEEEDYIYGAFMLYLDIINIFLQLLELLRIFMDNNGN